MATRLYFKLTTPSVSPAYSPDPPGGFANADRQSLTVTKDGSVMTSKAVTGSNYLGHRQLVSEPLQNAVTFNSGVTVKLAIRAQSSGTSTFLVVVLKVVSNNGSTLRGYMANPEEMTTNAFATAGLTCRYMTFTCSTVNAQAGDRIVLEILHQSSNSRTATYSYGCDSATDLPENQTETNAYNPWLQFSNDFTFQSSGAATPKNLMLLGVG